MKLLDTSAVILFVDYIPETQCIYHLCSIGHELNITKEVYSEYHEKSEFWFDEDFVKIHICEGNISFIKRDVEEIKQRIAKKYFNLGDGELSIIALAILLKEENKDCYCVLDDKRARSKAKLLGLNVIGSIGLMKIINDNNKWRPNQINNIIRAIDASPFHVSDQILEVLKNG